MANVRVEIVVSNRFEFSNKAWRATFVASMEPTPAGRMTCPDFAACNSKDTEKDGYKVGFVKLVNLHLLDSGDDVKLGTPEAKDVEQHLATVLNSQSQPVFLCERCLDSLDEILTLPA